jgi:hypothetical protein
MARVPRSIKNNDSVCSNKVHTKAPSPCGNQEKLDVGICVEVVDESFPF